MEYQELYIVAILIAAAAPAMVFFWREQRFRKADTKSGYGAGNRILAPILINFAWVLCLSLVAVRVVQRDDAGYAIHPMSILPDRVPEVTPETIIPPEVQDRKSAGSPSPVAISKSKPPSSRANPARTASAGSTSGFAAAPSPADSASAVSSLSPEAEAAPTASSTSGSSIPAEGDESPEANFAAYWNTWFENSGCFLLSTCRSRSVVAGENYKLVVSISNEEFANMAAQASQKLTRVLDSRPSVILRMVPILTDEKITLTGKRTSFDLKIDTRKLRVKHTDIMKRVSEGAYAALDAAHDVSAGSQGIPIHVGVDSRGCSKVPISVWMEGFEEAVDELIVPVSIGTSYSDVDSCESNELKSSPVAKGAAALASATSPAVPAGNNDDRVALHIFDLDDASYTVLVAKRGKARFIYGWANRTRFGDAFALDGDLLSSIQAARDSLDVSKPAENRATAYANAANILKDHIFAAQTATSTRQAADALKLLQTVVDETPGTMIAARLSRTSTLRSSLYYAPLRLLAADGAGIVKNGFDVVMPLPLAHQGDACVAHWTIFASKEMADSLNDSDAKDALARIIGRQEGGWLTKNYKLMKEFADHMASTEENPVDTKHSGEAEGLIILAHHGERMGLFAKEAGVTRTISANQLNRESPVGSVVVLGACSTGAPTSAENIIKQFNHLNFDSVVTSPYPVLTEYSVRFVDAFVSALSAAYQDNSKPRLQQLFDNAAKITGEGLSTKSGDDKYLQEAIFEYVLAGNPEIRLCGNPEVGSGVDQKH